MLFRKCEPTNLEHISDSYSLDWKFGANSIADGYQAYDKANKRHCALWITRERLSDTDRLNFYEHTRSLRKGGLERISRYGCDIDGVGYVALPILAVKSLDYDTPDAHEKARRLLLSILKVEAFHLQGLVCGNICVDSFMVDSDNKVHFVGYAGGDLEKKARDIPAQYQTFIPPEEVSSDQSSQVTDVYALAVMGLTLFGATFPDGVISPDSLPEYLKTLDPKAPLWLHAVLPRAISCRPEQRYKSASELLAAITVQAERQRAVPSEDQDLRSVAHDTRGEADIILQLPRGAVRLRSQIRGLLNSPRFIIGVTSALLGVMLGAAWLVSSRVTGATHSGSESERVRLLSGEGLTHDVLGSGEQKSGSLGDNLRALLSGSEYRQADSNPGSPGVVGTSSTSPRPENIVSGTASSDNSAGEIEPSPPVVMTIEDQWRARLEQSQRAGFRHTADVLGYLINTPNTIRPSDIDRLLEVLGANSTKEKRRDLVISYESVDPDLSYMVAAALTLDLAEPGLFRDLLTRGALKQIGVSRAPVDSISTAALIASIPSSREFFLEDISSGTVAISDDEVWWLLETLILQRAEQLRRFTLSGRMSKMKIGARRFFLQSIAQGADIEGAPIGALLKNLREGPDVTDVQKYSQWYDSTSVQVLLATLLVSSDPEVVQNAFDALANKSTGNPSVDKAIAYIRANADSVRVYYGSFIGGVGLVDSLNQEEVQSAFSSVRGKPQVSKLCTILLQKGSPTLVSAILETLGDTINPALLVDLLRHPDKSVRLRIIPFVKNVSLATSWQQVIDAYVTEPDPEVKARYESEIPRIRGS